MKNRTTKDRESDSRKAVRAMLAQGLTQRQMASAMGVSVEAVRKHVRALKALSEEER